MRAKMKQVQISAYGVPEVVAHCVELEDVGAPDIGEVVFDVLAFPINPADIMFCRGTYRLRPPLPATPGAECVGRVVVTGAVYSREENPSAVCIDFFLRPFRPLDSIEIGT
jgi:NADPH:quinone reductase-like Zn-dependent oxidoreductase